jgi:hypothetical protein
VLDAGVRGEVVLIIFEPAQEAGQGRAGRRAAVEGLAGDVIPADEDEDVQDAGDE